MKEGFDKEIDSLLRRRARWTAAGSLADGDGNGAATPASAHLDADELGAFAEGALPAGARLAATTHLADCDRCRGVVVSLSRVLGGIESKQNASAAAPASAEAPRPASWRAWTAALFSPRALRYAVPLLAVSLVAVVSFVALRSRDAGSLPNTQSARPQTEVAQTRPDAGSAEKAMTANVNQSGVPGQPGETESGAATSVATRTEPPSVGRGPNAGEPQPAPVTSVAEDASAPPPAAAPPATSAGPEATTEIAKSAPKPVAVETAQPPAKSDGEDNNREKRARGAEPADEIASNEAAMQRRRAANEVQMPDGGARNQKRGADNSASRTYEEGNAAAGATQRESERDGRGGSFAARRRPNARAEQKTEGGETRAAAGHRFRREGSAWVDVNYKPSMRSTGVRRGTEAFRALVADVPVIGRVAEQIAGEVVVVVGGQAYRIR
ncbi:MAG TPA: hypothetical protein VGB98_11375 [Pyrinomonadaceae bacterium]|jgi:hypothetical protein